MTNYFVEDVNNDGRTDLIVYDARFNTPDAANLYAVMFHRISAPARSAPPRLRRYSVTATRNC